MLLKPTDVQLQHQKPQKLPFASFTLWALNLPSTAWQFHSVLEAQTVSVASGDAQTAPPLRHGMQRTCGAFPTASTQAIVPPVFASVAESCRHSINAAIRASLARWLAETKHTSVYVRALKHTHSHRQSWGGAQLLLYVHSTKEPHFSGVIRHIPLTTEWIFKSRSPAAKRGATKSAHFH